MGLLLRVHVHPANIPDREGAKVLLADAKRDFPRLSILWADQGYDGAPFQCWVNTEVACELAVTNKPAKWTWAKAGQPAAELGNFTLLARRWVVERSFAWSGRNRRLSKDYEGLAKTSETFIYQAMSRLMLRRLAAT